MRQTGFVGAYLALLVSFAFLNPHLPGDFRIFPELKMLLPASVRPAFTEWKNSLTGDSAAEVPTEEKTGPEKDFESGRESYIERPQSLRHFLNSLSELKSGNRSHVRILHYGDSLLWGDTISHSARYLFQQEYGDGGIGLVNVIDVPSSKLKGHTNSTRRGFRYNQIPFEVFHMPALPELGFRGASAKPRSTAAEITHSIPGDSRHTSPWKTARIITYNRSAGFEPDKNDYDLNHPVADTAVIKDLNCSHYEYRFREPGKDVTIRINSQNAVSSYIDGLVLESETGLTYSPVIRMGIHQAWFSGIEEKRFACNLGAYGPDLIIWQFGVNESASLSSNYKGFTKEKYRKQLDDFYAMIDRTRAGASVLIFGPFERLQNSRNGLTEHKAQATVIQVQRELAEKYRFAYFDTYSYLGGPGQMKRMVESGLAMNDYTHVTVQGGEKLAEGLFSEVQKLAGNPDSVRAVPEQDPESEQDFSLGEDNLMQFNSTAYIYFLLLVILIASAFSKYPNARLILFLAASVFFYGSWKLWPVLLLVFSTVLDYFCGHGIVKSQSKGGRGRRYLVMSLAGNLGMLFAFKYLDFVISLIVQIPGIPDNLASTEPVGLLLPAGISFYTFQTLSYTIDIYRGNLKPESSILRFALFVSFFPQLVAGPIVRAKEFLTNLTDKIRHFHTDRKVFDSAVFLITCGMLKKVSADWLAFYSVDPVYDNPTMFTSVEIITAWYAYALQIYFDFSGYTDIAIGSANLLGFNLTLNFNRPYQSSSIGEFWRRWHISLGSWLRDYLYISLGGNRGHVYRNLLLTMAIAGVWHGAGIQFVVWGIYHGILLAAERLTGWEERFENLRPLKQFLNFHLVLAGWVVFRTQDLQTVEQMFQVVSRFDLRLINTPWWVLLFMAAAFIWHFTPVSLREKLDAVYSKQKLLIQALGIFVATVIIYQLTIQEVRPFIYFQF